MVFYNMAVCVGAHCHTNTLVLCNQPMVVHRCAHCLLWGRTTEFFIVVDLVCSTTVFNSAAKAVVCRTTAPTVDGPFELPLMVENCIFPSHSLPLLRFLILVFLIPTWASG